LRVDAAPGGVSQALHGSYDASHPAVKHLIQQVEALHAARIHLDLVQVAPGERGSAVKAFRGNREVWSADVRGYASRDETYLYTAKNGRGESFTGRPGAQPNEALSDDIALAVERLVRERGTLTPGKLFINARTIDPDDQSIRGIVGSFDPAHPAIMQVRDAVRALHGARTGNRLVGV